MYLGAIMGAGFASGREAWQYFGLFGDKAYLGLVVASALFVAVGMMTSYIALHLKTADMGMVILPVRNEKLSTILGYIVAFMIYTALIAMSAAGGSLLNQQFGLPKYIGGIIVVFLVIITVLGDFERVSRVFRLIMPILFIIDVGLCLYVAFTYKDVTPIPAEAKPSAMASIWPAAAVIYVAYNTLGTIPIMSQSALNSRSKKDAIFGSFLGGIFLGVLGLVLVVALQKDGQLSHMMDLPMLAFAAKVSPVINAVFAVVLFFAVYSAATSTFYGFTTMLKKDNKKKYKIIFFAVLGFFLGLFGFKNIIAYVYPIEGYFGFIVIILITANFIRVLMAEKRKKNGSGL